MPPRSWCDSLHFLSRPEFHRRYEQMPDLRKAELLESSPSGILRGEIFPGLTLALGPLFAGDLRGVLEELERGMAQRH
jgi:hypothetical protein